MAYSARRIYPCEAVLTDGSLCGKDSFRAKLCHKHYEPRRKRPQGPCPECDDGAIVPLRAGLCNKHYLRRLARRKKMYGQRPTPRLARDFSDVYMMMEFLTAGIGAILQEADGGPLPWPVVEKQLLVMYEEASTLRRPLLWQRVIRAQLRAHPIVDTGEDERESA